MTLIDPQIHRFSRAEYRQMAELGFFAGHRVELISGEILDMAPQNEPHVWTISALMRILAQLPAQEFEIRCQAPLFAQDESEPEPDFAVTRAPASPREDAPATALLVIEISHSTLARDRRKANLYAAADVQEYWLVNLKSRQIEFYAQPTADPASEFGARYLQSQTLGENESLKSAALPLPTIPLSQILPPKR